MKNYFLRRLLRLIPRIGVISLIAFILVNLTPLDPASVALRANDITLTDEIVQQTRLEFGLDRPFIERYSAWLWGILHFNFGYSFITRRPVSAEMLLALPITLKLTALAALFIVMLSLSIALICAFFPNGRLDRGLRGIIFTLTAIPNYWLALLLIWGLSVRLNLFPVSGITAWNSYLLPAFSLSLGYTGLYVRLLRGAMLNQQTQPYVLYAKARGLSRSRILLRHVLPNALTATLTGFAMSLPKLLAGSVVIENIFALPGLGRLCVQAIFNRDYPMIQAYILFMAALFLTFNFLADLLRHQIDPRLNKARA